MFFCYHVMHFFSKLIFRGKMEKIQINSSENQESILSIAMKNFLQENTMYNFIPVNLRNLKKTKP